MASRVGSASLIRILPWWRLSSSNPGPPSPFSRAGHLSREGHRTGRWAGPSSSAAAPMIRARQRKAHVRVGGDRTGPTEVVGAERAHFPSGGQLRKARRGVGRAGKCELAARACRHRRDPPLVSLDAASQWRGGRPAVSDPSLAYGIVSADGRTRSMARCVICPTGDPSAALAVPHVMPCPCPYPPACPFSD